MDNTTAIIAGALVAHLIDLRIFPLALIGGLASETWRKALVASLVSSCISFALILRARYRMAEILDIPDPNVTATFIWIFAASTLIVFVVFGIRLAIRSFDGR